MLSSLQPDMQHVRSLALVAICPRQSFRLKLTHLLIASWLQLSPAGVQPLQLPSCLKETTGVADPIPFIQVFDNAAKLDRSCEILLDFNEGLYRTVVPLLEALFAAHFALRAVICVVDLQRVHNILNEPKEM